MKRLFVDCDDTLVIYESATGEINPYGAWKGEPFERNETLIKFLYEFDTDFLVIWSGGGANYAEVIANLLGIDELNPTYLIKDKTTFELVRPGDIVIDDQNIEVDTEVWRPDDERIATNV